MAGTLPVWSLIILFVSEVSCLLAVAAARNITRSRQDIFTVSDCSRCALFGHATCQQRHYSSCQCPELLSVFLAHENSCYSAKNLTVANNCLHWHDSDELLKVLNLSSQSKTWIRRPREYTSCSVTKQQFSHMDNTGAWVLHSLAETAGEAFSVTSARGRRSYFKVNGNAGLDVFSGRIIKIGIECKMTGTRNDKKIRCLVFKAKGTLSYIPPPVRPQTTSTTTVLTVTDATVTTPDPVDNPTTEQYTTPHVKPHQTRTSQKTTGRVKTASWPIFSPTTNASRRAAVIGGAVTMETEDEEVLVTIIAVVGAITCVAIICASAWCIIKHKLATRHASSSLQDTRPCIISSASMHQTSIPMSMMMTSSNDADPVYSELPDILDTSISRHAAFHTPTHSSDSVNKDAPFPDSVRPRPIPRKRCKTDPLPVVPERDRQRPVTPDLHRGLHTRVDLTSTARLLSEINMTSTETAVCRNLDYQELESKQKRPMSVYQPLESSTRGQEEMQEDSSHPSPEYFVLEDPTDGLRTDHRISDGSSLAKIAGPSSMHKQTLSNNLLH